MSYALMILHSIPFLWKEEVLVELELVDSFKNHSWRSYILYCEILYIVMWDNIRVVCAYELLYGEEGHRNSLSLYASCIFFTYTHTNNNFLNILLSNKYDSHAVNVLILMQGYVDFGQFDKLNYFVTGLGKVDFVQVSCISTWTASWETL